MFQAARSGKLGAFEIKVGILSTAALPASMSGEGILKRSLYPVKNLYTEM